MDKIEIVYFETDGGLRLGRNSPTVMTELTYCEWRRNADDWQLHNYDRILK